MTDQEILNLVYDYADGFTSHILFKEEQVLQFAKALLGQTELTVSTRSFYADPFVDQFLAS